MKTPNLILLLLVVSLSLPRIGLSQASAIGYQGHLNDNGLPASGLYNFTFTLFATADGGAPVAEPLSLNALLVSNGVFHATLDFGPDVFSGAERWLEISVQRNAGGAVSVLSPRLALLPTPYALHAYRTAAVVDGGITSSALADGAVTGAKLSAAAPLPGQLLGYDGDKLAWTTMSGSSDSFWLRNSTGNKIYYNGGNVGIFDPNPAFPLTVRSGANQYGIEHTDGTRRLATYVGASGAWLGTISSDSLNFYVGAGGSSMTVTTSGKVGIGTTTPDARLTVRTTGTFGSYGIEHTDGDVRLSTFLDSGFGAWLGTRSNHPLNFFVNDGTPSLSIGIGGATTVTPIGGYGSMTLGTPNGESGLSIRSSNRADVRFDGTTLKLVAGPGAGPPSSFSGLAVHTSGNVGVGTIDPQTKLHVQTSGGAEVRVTAGGERAIVALDSTLAGQNRVWTLESGLFGTPGLFGIYDRTAGRARLTIDPNGVVGVDVLQIRGGSDLSEHFDIATAEGAGDASPNRIEPGLVASIDPENPGKLVVSSRAYDRRVAGIISGAGGVKPGMIMSQAGSVADGAHPVALTGRVFCFVDAAYGAIEPGDLLTTSDTPGHAMKVTDHSKAQGAILGKAMGACKAGKGMVLVLVTLQ